MFKYAFTSMRENFSIKIEIKKILISWSLYFSYEAEKFIIDTDAGIDDAFAISLLLRAEALRKINYKIVAITCVHGNAREEDVEQNVLTTLKILNRTDVSIL